MDYPKVTQRKGIYDGYRSFELTGLSSLYSNNHAYSFI